MEPTQPKPRNIPLGLIDLSEYEQFDVELEPGDCLVSYTDALSNPAMPTARCWARTACCESCVCWATSGRQADRDPASRDRPTISREPVRRRRDRDGGASQRGATTSLLQRHVQDANSISRLAVSWVEPLGRASSPSRLQPGEHRRRYCSRAGSPLAGPGYEAPAPGRLILCVITSSL